MRAPLAPLLLLLPPPLSPEGDISRIPVEKLESLVPFALSRTVTVAGPPKSGGASKTDTIKMRKARLTAPQQSTHAQEEDALIS